ncbi:hypothetical protein PILCRDRAFT_7333 [Piloderma croceum F 1598]|uniref:DUF6533 domain-containing protein n=1 Tax=Piloderma croceum (strain F 1598) TaxID=765440 RepID=A0A0C3FVC4_PILCF|nr:hypothetical protein PILCRDRAFT_7333 [Piloderma croceum F 1598]
MSGPSTTNYLPLDSDAPSVFSITLMNDRIFVAFTMLLLYDHIITLDMEIEWIWTFVKGA